jgi:hypothetical protein
MRRLLFVAEAPAPDFDGDMSFDGGADIYDDGPGGDDWGETPSYTDATLSTLEYGEQLVAEPKKVKSTFLHFARVPKKVDVKRLKENLWEEMETSTQSKVSLSCSRFAIFMFNTCLGFIFIFLEHAQIHRCCSRIETKVPRTSVEGHFRCVLFHLRVAFGE